MKNEKMAIVAILFSALLVGLPSRARAQRIELFGGYSFTHASAIAQGQGELICPGTNCPITYSYSNSSANLNGWEIAGTYSFGHILSAAADFTQSADTAHLSTRYSGAVNGSTTGTLDDTLHLDTYLFGPQLSLPGRISPFVQIMVGAAHLSQSDISPEIEQANPAVGSSFAAAFGGGIDFKLVPRLWVRPIQFRELITRFGSGTQSQPTISAGIVLHL